MSAVVVYALGVVTLPAVALLSWLCWQALRPSTITSSSCVYCPGWGPKHPAESWAPWWLSDWIPWQAHKRSKSHGDNKVAALTKQAAEDESDMTTPTPAPRLREPEAETEEADHG